MPNSPNEPLPGQDFPLSRDRQASTIPKSSGKEGETWVYPSEQMFFNAMLKKGWKYSQEELKPEDLKHIITIHNRNNEDAWQEILKWEALHAQCVSISALVYTLRVLASYVLFNYTFTLGVCVCVRACVRVCVCVCVH